MTPPLNLGPQVALRVRGRARAHRPRSWGRGSGSWRRRRGRSRKTKCAPRDGASPRRAAFCEEPRSAKSRVLRRAAHLPSAAGKRNDAVRRRPQVANAETRRRLAEESTRVEVYFYLSIIHLFIHSFVGPCPRTLQRFTLLYGGARLPVLAPPPVWLSLSIPSHALLSPLRRFTLSPLSAALHYLPSPPLYILSPLRRFTFSLLSPAGGEGAQRQARRGARAEGPRPAPGVPPQPESDFVRNSGLHAVWSPRRDPAAPHPPPAVPRAHPPT